MTTSWARSRAPSFISTRLTWVLAVVWLMCAVRTISSLDIPAATRVSTSRSRREHVEFARQPGGHGQGGDRHRPVPAGGQAQRRAEQRGVAEGVQRALLRVGERLGPRAGDDPDRGDGGQPAVEPGVLAEPPDPHGARLRERTAWAAVPGMEMGRTSRDVAGGCGPVPGRSW